jgi:hypothetical protein
MLTWWPAQTRRNQKSYSTSPDSVSSNPLSDFHASRLTANAGGTLRVSDTIAAADAPPGVHTSPPFPSAVRYATDGAIAATVSSRNAIPHRSMKASFRV